MERDQLIEQLFKSGSKEEILESINEYQKKLEAATAIKEKMKRAAAIGAMIDYIGEISPELKMDSAVEYKKMRDIFENILTNDFEPYITSMVKMAARMDKFKANAKPVRSDARVKSDDQAINDFINGIMGVL